MYKERSTVFGTIELRKSTRAPAPLSYLGAEVCHPSLCIFCGNDELDGPLTGFEAKISDWPHTALTICDLNFSARLLLWHWDP
jgi:hypothetical protein